jgi:hypothetical protein
VRPSPYHGLFHALARVELLRLEDASELDAAGDDDAAADFYSAVVRALDVDIAPLQTEDLGRAQAAVGHETDHELIMALERAADLLDGRDAGRTAHARILRDTAQRVRAQGVGFDDVDERWLL